MVKKTKTIKTNKETQMVKLPFSKKTQTKRKAIENAGSRMFIAVIIASIIVSICFVLFKSLWDLRSFNSRVISERSSALMTLESNVEAVDKLELSAKALDEGDEINSQVVLDALPSKYDFPALFTSIAALAEEGKVDLKDFSGKDETQNAIESEIDPEPVQIPFTLSVEGSYEKITDFLETLEKTIRPMNINSIDLSGSNKAMLAKIELHTYYQPKVDVTLETKTVR